MDSRRRCDPKSVTLLAWIRSTNAHRQPSRSVVLHYAPLSGADEWVTAPARTVVDCARTLPFREGLAIVDSALRRGLVEPEELIDEVARSGGAGIRSARRAIANGSALSANPFESALRATCLDAGLVRMTPQYRISSGRQAWTVDLADERLRLIAEADSFTYHGTREALERDCRRYDELVSRGWTVLRFSWEHVMFDEPWVISILRDTARSIASRQGGSDALRGRSRGP